MLDFLAVWGREQDEVSVKTRPCNRVEKAIGPVGSVKSLQTEPLTCAHSVCSTQLPPPLWPVTMNNPINKTAIFARPDLARALSSL